ncbi:PTS sugar transporter subunit IIB, partial [Enterococcus faecalis]|uniref:PTS sugar transporter subunit IIB n=1 Tax=Enterococcus faecalis TaxID=1351 RepID=UPI003D6A25C2
FLITKDIAGMAALIGGGVPLQSFNIGNISQKEGSRAIKKSVALTDEDIQTVRRLTVYGVTFTAQMIPSDPYVAILT